ncbi:hypothetical protein BLOT_015452 [Blomia tropicalis]|nr:hypothetical protein BLOT_015452 [Blomia tropicalis]
MKAKNDDLYLSLYDLKPLIYYLNGKCEDYISKSCLIIICQCCTIVPFSDYQNAITSQAYSRTFSTTNDQGVTNNRNNH